MRFADLVQFADVDVVLCNPPQMPGEALAAALDKYGGADGAHFYRRLAAHGAALLGDGGRVVFLQTSFSSFAAVDALFGAAGFGVRTLKTQKRSASLAAIDAGAGLRRLASTSTPAAAPLGGGGRRRRRAHPRL